MTRVTDAEKLFRAETNPVFVRKSMGNRFLVRHLVAGDDGGGFRLGFDEGKDAFDGPLGGGNPDAVDEHGGSGSGGGEGL